MHCVKKTSKGLAFPSNIPKQRGSRAALAMIFVCIILLLIGSITTNRCILFTLSAVSCLLFTIFCEELIHRGCLLVEELQHLKSRYDNNKICMLYEVFFMSWSSWTVLALSIFLLIIINFIINENPFKLIFQENIFSFLSVFISMILLRRVLKIEKSPLYDSLQFGELQGADYGSGMAHSFFHGYLRIMLPHTGQQSNKGLREFQKDFEAKHGIKFEVYKIFILLPMSTHCPPSISSEFSPSVEDSKELESKELDRAGVKNRSYKNSVYKINTSSGKKKYITAEYATPVKTLGEVMKENTLCANTYKKHCKEIVLNFYLTLVDLLKNDETCHDLCEVIYYDDKDEEGRYIDVGGVILSRIRDIKKKTN